MTREQIEVILSSLLDKEDEGLDIPSKDDWVSLENKFNCRFSDEFRYFIELMTKYIFPGDILNISTGKTNGNDSVEMVYDYEMNYGDWKEKLIPFYAIGNGDYFCFNSEQSPNSPVYYYYSDQNKEEQYSDSFEDWIKELPDFLN